MKTLAKAAIFFEGIIFDKCNSGEKKIPPPIPTIPEIKPNKEPINREIIKGIFL